MKDKHLITSVILAGLLIGAMGYQFYKRKHTDKERQIETILPGEMSPKPKPSYRPGPPIHISPSPSASPIDQDNQCYPASDGCNVCCPASPAPICTTRVCPN